MKKFGLFLVMMLLPLVVSAQECVWKATPSSIAMSPSASSN